MCVCCKPAIPALLVEYPIPQPLLSPFSPQLPLLTLQAESGAKTAAELRQQLSASQRQQESQSLAAAAAAAEAQRLRGKLQQREEELGRALADRSELQDTVESLRSQVSIVKTQLGRTRVLQCMQAPGC